MGWNGLVKLLGLEYKLCARCFMTALNPTRHRLRASPEEILFANWGPACRVLVENFSDLAELGTVEA